MSKFKCSVCGQGITDGITVYRNAPKGKPCDDYRCEFHLDPEYQEAARSVLGVTHAIEKHNMGEQ